VVIGKRGNAGWNRKAGDGEGFNRPRLPLILMIEEVRRKIDALFKTNP
jgi:hypothetical protein